MSAVAGTNELVGVGRSICDAIGIPGVTHASLVGELGVSKWGAVVAEAVVTSAEVNLCPERRYAVPAVSAPAVAPAPQAPPAQPEPAPEPREEPSSAYYKNCDAARADGAAPLHAGDPATAAHSTGTTTASPASDTDGMSNVSPATRQPQAARRG